MMAQVSLSLLSITLGDLVEDEPQGAFGVGRHGARGDVRVGDSEVKVGHATQRAVSEFEAARAANLGGVR